ASSSIEQTTSASSGVSGEGLMTIELPESSAGASFDIVTNCGTFHGTMAATTPTPSWRTSTSGASVPGRRSSHGNSDATAMNELSISHGAGVCASCENEIGEPISVVM